MSIMNRVTWKTMRLNRVRTIVTVIGIILSTAMFTAVISICTSLYNSFREGEIAQSGNYHAHLFHGAPSAFSSAAEDERLEYIAFAEDIGYALSSSKNEAKPYIFVMGADEKFLENMPVKLIGGRLPENENELLIPEHAMTNGGLSYNVGDTLELELGTRIAAESEDAPGGESLYQENPFMFELERLVPSETRSYTVTGIYARPDFEPYSAPGYTALTLSLGEPSEGSVYDCYLRVKNPREYLNFISEHPELSDLGGEEHTTLLALEGVTRYDNISRVLTGFAIILSVLIFMGSVSLIYSAFSISVSERTKQFGLLSSIGATKKQIRGSVLFEAVTLSALGIPAGVAAGTGGIALTLFLLKGNFTRLLEGGMDISIRLHVTPMGLIAAALIAFLTVLVSAWIPSRRAMRITPIEAIRQSRDVKAKARSSRVPRIIVKLFGAEGMLAKKYYTRSSHKYRATILSLVMSVVLFVAASGFCLYVTRSVNAVDNRPGFDGSCTGVERQTFELVRDALAEQTDGFAGYIQTDSGTAEFHYTILTDSETTPEYKRYLDHVTLDGLSVSHVQKAAVIYMDDASFRELLKANSIPEEGFFDPASPKAVILNHESAVFYEHNSRINYVFDFLKPGTASLRISRPCEVPEGYYEYGAFWTGDRFGEGELRMYYAPEAGASEYDDAGRSIGTPTAPIEFDELEIGAMTESKAVGSVDTPSIKAILPFSAYKGESETVSFFFNSSDVQGDIARMQEVLKAAGAEVSERSFHDMTEENRTMNSVVTIVKVFSYGFIALISLISVANVFNTVTTNVALRRRDYAMLRSMGMTEKGMNRMSKYECLIYGTRSLLIGLPIAIGVTYLVYRTAFGAAQMRFELPVTAMIISVVSVFLVVFVSMLYSTNKLKKDDPVEALKDENI